MIGGVFIGMWLLGFLGIPILAILSIREWATACRATLPVWRSRIGGRVSRSYFLRLALPRCPDNSRDYQRLSDRLFHCEQKRWASSVLCYCLIILPRPKGRCACASSRCRSAVGADGTTVAFQGYALGAQHFR